MKSLEIMLSEIRNEPPANDLINDLLPDSSQAYMLICGRSGIGKTFIALNILFCLATGTPWLSHKVEQCRVAYFSMEGAKRKIGERFETISKSFDKEALGRIYWEHSMPITLNTDGVNELTRILTIPHLKVAVIDPMSPLVPGDYTSPKDASLFLKNLSKVQNDSSTRLILLHHIRKPDRKVKVQPEDLQYEVKGASEYVEAAQTVLLLERAPQARDGYGKFLEKTSDLFLHFVKVKDAPSGDKPVRLRLNRETLLFEPITDFYQDEGA